MFKTGKQSGNIHKSYLVFNDSKNIPDVILKNEFEHYKNLLEKFNLNLKEVHKSFNQGTVKINRSALEMKDVRVSNTPENLEIFNIWNAIITQD